MNQSILLNQFEKIFGNSTPGSVKTYFAPGRVNLIGEHIDYNAGYVFPCAIGKGTYLAIRLREDEKIRAYSGNFEAIGVIEECLSDLTYKASRDWLNYPLGVLYTLAQEGFVAKQGFDAYFYGDLPNGAGLSSSASIELVTAVMLNDVFGFEIPKERLAVLCQTSENQYNGVNCGIMDQFAIAMGKKDHAVLLNCDTLDYDYVPFQLTDHTLIIINSNKKRSLAESNYNERRESCEEAFAILKHHKEIKGLCDLTLEAFNLLSTTLPSERILKRARHAVTENKRVIDAVEALKNNDLVTFGKLMNASHESLKTDFEVTGVELDTLAYLAQSFEGVLGSRMTGAGFGGCTVTLIEKSKVADFMTFIEENYYQSTGLKAECYEVTVEEGARVL